jgi:peptide/nickel transport system permease protein
LAAVGQPVANPELYYGISNQDYPLIQALFLMITVAVLVAVLAVDLLTAVLDPRTRDSG